MTSRIESEMFSLDPSLNVKLFLWKKFMKLTKTHEEFFSTQRMI